MKLLASAAALACAVVAVVASPALSVGRDPPTPVDFELAPQSGAAHAAGVGLISRPLRAPKRFNLVGMRWRGGGEPRIAIRTRRAGGRWTRWRALPVDRADNPDRRAREPDVAASDPAWVGEADEIQYRTSRRLPGLRLHFVNVKGTATAADRRRTALRRAAHAALAPIAGLLGARSATAQEAMPSFVSRAQWGAAACPPRSAPAYGTVKAVFVHHTVNTNDYTPAEAPQIVLAICRYHRNSNGWNDIGYQALVDRFGTLYEGRAGGLDKAVVGAQAQGYNAESAGIASLGDHTTTPASSAALDGIARYVRWKLPLHGAPTAGGVTLTSAGGPLNRYPSGAPVPVERVSGHRDGDATSCPGEALYAQLPELRRRVGGVLPAVPGTALAASLTPTVIDHGASARLDAQLSGPSGGPLGGESVQIQMRRAGRWRLVRALGTDPAGRISATLRERTSSLLRARFGGRVGLAPASSRSLRLGVRAVVRLPRPPGRGVRGAPLLARGTVAPARRAVWQRLELQRRGRWVRVGLKRVAVRRGRFIASFVPAGTGLYRAFVIAPRYSSNERGSSRAWVVRVVRGRAPGGAAAPR